MMLHQVASGFLVPPFFPSPDVTLKPPLVQRTAPSADPLLLAGGAGCVLSVWRRKFLGTGGQRLGSQPLVVGVGWR